MKDGGKPVAGRSGNTDVDLLLSGGREQLKALFPMPPRRPRLARVPRKSRRIALAVGLLAVASAWLIDPAYRQESYASPAEARQQLMLADGTRVDLDVDSRIRVHWHLRSRQVELLAGRALFSVSPAWVRPFEVAADTFRVRVLGTRFEVRRQGSDVEVKVAEGRVSVRGETAERELVAGQRIAGRSGRLGPVEAVSPEAVLAWREGRLLFDRTPLSEVLGELQPYAGQRLRAVGPAGALEVSGVADSARAADFLAMLPEIVPVVAERAADGVLELRRK